MALEALMFDPDSAMKMGDRARARAVSHFSVDAEAKRIAMVYQHVLG